MLQGDYELGGGWGARVSLTYPNNFSSLNLNTDLVDVNGHYTPRPSVGQTLVGEFEKSYIKFEFIEVKYCRDPDDMFFAKVKAVEQKMKAAQI